MMRAMTRSSEEAEGRLPWRVARNRRRSRPESTRVHQHSLPQTTGKGVVRHDKNTVGRSNFAETIAIPVSWSPRAL